MDGRKLAKEAKIKEEVVNAFQNFVRSRELETKYSGLPFFTLENLKVGLLEAAFYEELIETALFSSGPDEFA